VSRSASALLLYAPADAALPLPVLPVTAPLPVWLRKPAANACTMSKALRRIRRPTQPRGTPEAGEPYLEELWNEQPQKSHVPSTVQRADLLPSSRSGNQNPSVREGAAWRHSCQGQSATKRGAGISSTPPTKAHSAPARGSSAKPR